MFENDRPTLPPLPSRVERRLRSLLAMRVSVVLDAVPGPLEALTDQGFTPPAQRGMRRMPASTVRLERAPRLRALPDSGRGARLRLIADSDVREDGDAACR